MRVNFFLRNKDIYTSRRLLEEAGNLNIDFSVYDPLKVSILGQKLLYDGQKIDDCDFAFFRGSVEAHPREQILALADFYESKKICTVNKSSSILVSANKWSCRTHLENSGVTIPKAAIVSSSVELEKTVSFLGGFPVLLKFFYGSSGVGVVYVPNMYTLLSLHDAYRVAGFSFYIEEFLASALNGVRRIIATRDSIIADFIMHPSKEDFRSNFAKNGIGEIGQETESLRDVAVNSVIACGLTYGSVDMVMVDGAPIVLEVNSSPGIEMAEKVTGENIASIIIRASLQTLQ